MLYFNLDEGFEAFPEIADYSSLIEGLNSIKFCQNILEVLKEGCIILDFFQLVQGILSKLTSYVIDKGLRISKILLEKDLRVRLRNRNSTLVAALVLGQYETDGATKKYGDKQNMVNPSSA